MIKLSYLSPLLMPAAQLNLIIEKGASFKKDIVWKAGVAQTPVDLTGCTAKMQIRESYESATVILELTSSPSLYLTLGTTNGTISINIPPTVTRDIGADKALYDLEITHPDTSVTRLLYGTVDIKPEITL